MLAGGHMSRFFGLALGAVLAASSAALAQNQPADAPIFRNVPDTKLAPMAGLPDCFTAAVERGDPSTEPSVFLIQGTAGCEVPWHWHSVIESVMMSSGTLRLEMKSGQPTMLRAGGYARLPMKHVHRGACTTRCTFFVVSDGPFDLHYVDEAGNEIPAEQALKTAKKTSAY